MAGCGFSGKDWTFKKVHCECGPSGRRQCNRARGQECQMILGGSCGICMDGNSTDLLLKQQGIL